jgi:hypothetical protein
LHALDMILILTLWPIYASQVGRMGR